eukprot:5106601-Lingulodinium_polyedra.AAC.1
MLSNHLINVMFNVMTTNLCRNQTPLIVHRNPTVKNLQSVHALNAEPSISDADQGMLGLVV